MAEAPRNAAATPLETLLEMLDPSHPDTIGRVVRFAHAQTGGMPTGPFAHAEAAKYWKWRLTHCAEDAVALMTRLTAGLLGEHLAASDPDLVAVPAGACQAIVNLHDMLRDDGGSHHLPEHLGYAELADANATILYPHLLPEGHPLRDAEKFPPCLILGKANPVLFIGTPRQIGMQWVTPAAVSLKLVARLARVYLSASNAMFARIAEEKRRRELAEAKDERERMEAAAAREAFDDTWDAKLRRQVKEQAARLAALEAKLAGRDAEPGDAVKP